REVVADVVLVPAGVVPALVVAAVGPVPARGQVLLGDRDGVRRAVRDAGGGPLGATAGPDDDALGPGVVAEGLRRARVPPGLLAQRRRGHVAEALVDLALEEAGAAGVVAAAGAAVELRRPAARAVVDVDELPGHVVLAAVVGHVRPVRRVVAAE